MQTFTFIIILAFAVVLTYFFLKSKFQNQLKSGSDALHATEKEKEVAVSSLRQAKEQLATVQKILDDERNKIIRLNADLAEARANNQNLLEKLESEEKKLMLQFENLANKILEDKSAKFTEQNRKNLDIILDPLKEKIKDFEQKVEKAYNTESAERNSLKGEIKTLFELNKKISEEASNLTTALKGDVKQQGNWGELMLERILESSGLIRGEEYELQVSSTNNEDQRIIIDAVVFLPEEKHIIIDSKVSLNAYQAFVSAATADETEQHKKNHLHSVRNHIKNLSGKNYQTAKGLLTPDFVLMFIPIESSFGVAVQADHELFNFAWERKIVMVSPSTLLATLRTISSIWKQERQTRNALQIADEGGKLYDKFVGFVEDLLKVGRKMDDAKGDYVEAMKKLSDGTGNLIKRAEKMRELGAKANKILPQQLIERAE